MFADVRSFGASVWIEGFRRNTGVFSADVDCGDAAEDALGDGHRAANLGEAWLERQARREVLALARPEGIAIEPFESVREFDFCLRSHDSDLAADHPALRCAFLGDVFNSVRAH